MKNFAKEILRKIENKEDLTDGEFNMLKCILAGFEAYDEKMNELLELD